MLRIKSIIGIGSAAIVQFAVATGAGADACDSSSFKGPASEPMTFCAADDYVFARGSIGIKTHTKLEDVLDRNPKARMVFLQSGGGVAYSGARMGEIIRNRGLNTSAFGICASACLLAYLGGKERFKSKDAKIGFHRAVSLVELTKEERERTLNEVLQFLRAYFFTMGAEPEALEPAWKRSSFNMYWYNDKDARNWNLATTFRARKPAPPAKAFNANVASELGSKFTCELMTAYVNEWNRNYSKRRLDKYSKVLWGTTNCPEGRIRFRYQVKIDKGRMTKKAQANAARDVYCKDPVLREQMNLGWQVWMQMDFRKKKSRTIIVTCRNKG